MTVRYPVPQLSAAQEERLMDIYDGQSFRFRPGHRRATTRALRTKGMIANETGYLITHAGLAYVKYIKERRRSALPQTETEGDAK